ncbi:malignant fibrous histiocytoma-amplified sequence 1 homolog [Pecten maximus]|uniref:malignant fibrous histiocytoma-amplified sequence 1 homolog n=1 Tax=Pecten maximus TaxID=6579 RepID=UPI00145803AC|nr:malignant fibrous histiocytoma-amplified sequence 1 homolog [Pecten maximus]XP_033738645.1 malignant fibrous histiocytoma-amplified sequence 1 homolog [Pecten maximus]
MAHIYTPRSLSDIRELRMRIETEDPLFHGLKKLKMRGRDLSNIPPALFHLNELEVLDLSPDRQSCLTFRLMFVPRAICKLTNLKVLVLDTNELDEIPIEITKLVHIERLALSNNQLSWLPEGFNKLTNLRSLHLANNEFEDFPMQLCEIDGLEFLDLCDNKLHVLPVEISRLTELHTLLLFFNRLEALPDTICDMTYLHCLWIGNNLIKQLPRAFGNLKYLDWGITYTSSTLDGNPLVSPPIEICRMGPAAIEKYLNSSRGDLSSQNSRKGISNGGKNRIDEESDRGQSRNSRSKSENSVDGRNKKTTNGRDTRKNTRARRERNMQLHEYSDDDN